MARGAGTAVHLEAEQGDESWPRFKAGLFCFGVAVVILGAGFVALGRAGMLDPKSPDFAPVPHFFATAALLLGAFFTFQGYRHGRRHRLFGTSVVEANHPELGEPFVGVLRIAKPEAIGRPISLRLRCDWRHATSSPGHPSQGRMTTEHLWERSVELDPAAAGSGAPFRFDIPEDGLPSGGAPKPATGVHPGSPGDIVWTLRASSARPGTDYVAEFEVRVGPGRRNAEVGSEPDQAFASSPRPEQDSAALFRRVGLVAGIALSAIALVSLGRQVAFGSGATALRATVTAVEKNAVTLDFGGEDRAHRIRVSSFHRWERGQPVVALCETDRDGRRRCRMETGLDRWIDGLGTLAVAIVALSVWGFLRRRAGSAALPVR